MLFLILALAAFPLRGMAAVAMWHCAPNQHDAASASASEHAGHPNSHNDSAEHAGHHAPASDDAAGASTSTDKQVGSTCSACSACCMGGAIAPTAGSSLTFAPLVASRIAFVEPHMTGVVPVQLERPPLAQSL